MGYGVTKDRQGRRTTKVAAFALALTLAGSLLYFQATTGWQNSESLSLPWWLLLILFVGADSMVIHVEFRGDAQTFSLSELPIVLAWFFATPSDLLLARVLGGLIVIVFISRQSRAKVLFNTSLLYFYACFSLWVFHHLAPLSLGFGAEGWPAVYVALGLATVLDSVAIAVVIRLAGGEARLREVRKMVAIGVFGVMAVASLGLLAVTAIDQTPLAAGLILIIIGVLYGVFRSYSAISKRYEKLQQLYEFTQILNRSPEFGSAARAILAEARELLRSERAELSLRTEDGSGVMRVTLDERGELRTGIQPEDASDPAFLAAVENRKSVLVPRGTKDSALAASLTEHAAKDLIMVPLVQADAVIGTITMLNRLGDVTTFDEEDVKVLSTFANHAAMALENARLIDELRKEAEDRQHEALHDSLTGLANRSHLLQSTVQALVRTSRGGHTAVLLMDLDRFKEINDTLGHHHGDLLLQDVAKRLISVAPANALVARLGGDEFAILLPTIDSHAAAIATGERIHTIFRDGFSVEGVELTADGSIGVAVSPGHGTSPEELLQRADVAMYVAKGSDNCSVMLYEQEQNENSARRLALAAALRQAIDAGDLEVAYQPKARLVTGEVIGVEALARWEHASFGQIGPDEFIPLAEHVGLMRPLTMLILDKSLRQLSEWRALGLDLGVAVNLSVRNLLDGNLPRDVRALLERHGVDPAGLTLEITESEIMREPERTMLILGRLRHLGVSLSIDDFGTGHSSLAYLKRLPVDEVKIDRAFIGQIAENDIDSTIVRSIVDVARNRGLRVVAEGIEDQATWNVLRDLGCDVGQGYHLSRPGSGDDLTPWLLGQCHRARTGGENRGSAAEALQPSP
jgi:diguanylate cyclase (GGDEF)-like protein